MNILVIRLSSMGDVILTTPLLSFLHERTDAAKVTLLTDAAYAPLFAGDPRLARVVAFDRHRGTLDRDIVETRWDRVADLQNNRRSRRIVGMLRHAGTVTRFDKMHGKRFALLCLRIDSYNGAPDVAARNIRCVSDAELPAGPPPISLYFSDEERAAALTRFDGRAGPLLALFPFSAWRNKEWPQAMYVEVGRHFLGRGWQVAVFGGPDESERAEQLKAQIGPECVALAGRLPLRECGALLSGFSLALGNDTGLVHLARAAGVKTGVLFGPTTRHWGFYPYGAPPYRIFETPLRCRPCHAHGGNACIRLTRPCLASIRYETVIQGLEQLFGA